MADESPDLNDLLGSFQSLLRNLSREELKSLEQAVSDPEQVTELLSETLGIAAEHLKPEQKQFLMNLINSLFVSSKE